MIVRRIRSDEYKRARELMSLAFEFKFDDDRPDDEYARQMRENPQEFVDERPDCIWAAFEDDDKYMISSVCVIPFTARFDGSDTLMYGIGGVNTLPTHRRGGCVREIFTRALKEMRKEGGVFSYLYPFSTVYYSQFGYQRLCERKAWTVRLSYIPKWELGGCARLVDRSFRPEEDIRRIYSVWADKYNMMTREERRYDFIWVSEANPFKTCEYTYVYYSREGEPMGYMTFKGMDNKPLWTLECLRFHFTDTEGLKGLLTLLKSLNADHFDARFFLPADIDWQPLIPEASQNAVSCEVKPMGMARVISVERALMLAKARGQGELALEISDGQIPENDGRFLVSYADGHVVSVERTKREPDIAMGIGDFSRLLIGRHDVSALEYMDGVKLYCAPERAAELFYAKPVYITKPF